jgi:hypothetical protein
VESVPWSSSYQTKSPPTRCRRFMSFLFARSRNYEAYSMELPFGKRCLGVWAKKAPKMHDWGPVYIRPYFLGPHRLMWDSGTWAYGNCGKEDLVPDRYCDPWRWVYSTSEEISSLDEFQRATKRNSNVRTKVLALEKSQLCGTYPLLVRIKLIEMSQWIRSLSGLVWV